MGQSAVLCCLIARVEWDGGWGRIPFGRQLRTSLMLHDATLRTVLLHLHTSLMPRYVKFFRKCICIESKNWLVVLTILKSISQWEGLSHILWKIKIHVPNRQTEEASKQWLLKQSQGFPRMPTDQRFEFCMAFGAFLKKPRRL